MSKVHLVCGPVGAGKSTFAKQLEAKEGAVLLSLDEWMLGLYGEHMSRELFDERVRRSLELMLILTVRLIALGVPSS